MEASVLERRPAGAATVPKSRLQLALEQLQVTPFTPAAVDVYKIELLAQEAAKYGKLAYKVRYHPELLVEASRAIRRCVPAFITLAVLSACFVVLGGYAGYLERTVPYWVAGYVGLLSPSPMAILATVLAFVIGLVGAMSCQFLVAWLNREALHAARLVWGLSLPDSSMPERGQELLVAIKRLVPGVRFRVHVLGGDPIVEAVDEHDGMTETALVYGYDGKDELIEVSTGTACKIVKAPVIKV